MLKRIKLEKLMGYFDESGCYHCTNVEVVDQEATDAAIAECEQGWQDEMDECDSQISQYQALKDEIADKVTEANNLKGEFANNTTALNNANVTHPATDLSGCDSCLDNLISAYGEMSAQCDSEMEAWQAKRDTAESKKGSCPADTPKIYKTVCV